MSFAKCFFGLLVVCVMMISVGCSDGNNPMTVEATSNYYIVASESSSGVAAVDTFLPKRHIFYNVKSANAIFLDSILSITWDFGNSTTGTNKVGDASYDKEGLYVIAAVIVKKGGGTETLVKTIRIYAGIIVIKKDTIFLVNNPTRISGDIYTVDTYWKETVMTKPTNLGSLPAIIGAEDWRNFINLGVGTAVNGFFKKTITVIDNKTYNMAGVRYHKSDTLNPVDTNNKFLPELEIYKALYYNPTIKIFSFVLRKGKIYSLTDSIPDTTIIPVKVYGEYGDDYPLPVIRFHNQVNNNKIDTVVAYCFLDRLPIVTGTPWFQSGIFGSLVNKPADSNNVLLIKIPLSAVPDTGMTCLFGRDGKTINSALSKYGESGMLSFVWTNMRGGGIFAPRKKS